MLLTPLQVNYAMTLCVNSVNEAITTGYPDDNALSARFKGMTPNGSFVYRITYKDKATNEIDECNVYLQYSKTPDAQGYILTADY